MPCTFTTIEMQEKQRAEELARSQKREEERRREEIKRKREALVASLVAIGFEVASSESVDENEYIIATEKEG